MDGLGIFIQTVATAAVVGFGGWGIYSKLSDKVDKAKDAAQSAKNGCTELKGDIKELHTKLAGFSEICSAHRESFEQRVNRLEKIQNKKAKK